MSDPARHPAWVGYRERLRSSFVEAGGDDAARAAVVAAVVRRLGVDPAVCGLNPTDRIDVPAPAPGLVAPELPGLVLEHLLDPELRHRTGSHHTPPAIAAGLFEIAAGFDERAHPPVEPTVCDPTVGGGVFLLAAARALRRRGGAPAAILRCLFGADLDPLAVATTRAALACWAAEEGVEADPGPLTERIVVADGLDLDLARWPAGPPNGFDIVIGNPPFQSQLGADTARDGATRDRLRERFGAAVSGYGDSAGLFLVAATTLTRSAGRVAMIQPESFLAARDAAPVRHTVREAGGLSALWVAGARVFEAGVRVCAPVLTIGRTSRSVRRFRGADFEGLAAADAPTRADDDRGWGRLALAAYGTPDVRLPTTAGTVGDLATATAGFRDQFYGLAPHIVEGAPGHSSATCVSLVTVGCIDPLCCRWGTRPVRFAGRRWEQPLVDLTSLAEEARLSRWVADRLVPKVLVATQTRVVEAVVDEAGTLVPSVPVIAVTADPADLWSVAAVLLAPPVSAWALARAAGTALTADAVKLSAGQVLEVPLPGDRDRWRGVGRALARGDEGGPGRFGAEMCRAYGLPSDDPVLRWWLDRLPSWRGQPVGADGR